jgi:hypothetical protein
MSLLLDFHMAAQDLLQLIAKKAKQAAVNSEAAKEMETLQSFYDMVSALLSRGDLQAHEAGLQVILESTKAKILEMELKKAYNLIHSSGQGDILAKLLRDTVLPKKNELSEEVIIKNKQHA